MKNFLCQFTFDHSTSPSTWNFETYKIIECRCFFNLMSVLYSYVGAVISPREGNSCDHWFTIHIRYSFHLLLRFFYMFPTLRVLCSLAINVSDQIVSVTNWIYVNCTLLLTNSVLRMGCNQKTEPNCRPE